MNVYFASGDYVTTNQITLSSITIPVKLSGGYVGETDGSFDRSETATTFKRSTYNIRFIDESQYEFIYKSSGRIIESRISTYTLSYPTINFKDFAPKIVMKDETGTFIDKNTIRVGGGEYIKK